MATDTKLNATNYVLQGEGNVVSDMDGEKVMLSVSNGKYYNLGEIGGRIWDLIASPISIGQVVNLLLEEFSVDRAECERHVLVFLEQLSAEKLIHVGETVKLK
ncbi:lasso peptide biosynthesis PqqD family chaperone [Cohnella faecalis]|uniref:Lasso peptide biosynthesis PqqD family chaperone n=1 Tax=Cohnella faecalis TaxID=2315694 RepID=A0A398CKF1_9BACL|nr:lasso peptide biosynthesis PqqD family chaperone [Cohnella faecalis]RIE03786.1 lasso peptide biosynthesis PqqD family chaperone [Cohnella faecalis]